MRWKIESNRFGPQVLALIATLTLAVPALFYLFDSVLGFLGIRLEIIRSAMSVSFTAGVVLFVLFLLLLAVEFAQDRSMDIQSQRTRNRKLKISDEYYECQGCGNRRVRAADDKCQVCGQDLIDGTGN